MSSNGDRVEIEFAEDNPMRQKDGVVKMVVGGAETTYVTEDGKTLSLREFTAQTMKLDKELEASNGGRSNETGSPDTDER